MSRGTQLVKNTVIISFGTLLPKVLATISLPIVTAGLTKTEYGTYDLISILETLLLPFVTMQIQTAAFRFIIENRNNDEKKKEIISTMLSFLLVTLGLALIILFICLRQVEFNSRILVCLYFFFIIQANALQQIARGLDHMTVYSASAIVQSITNVVCIVVFVQFYNKGLVGTLLALAISAFSSASFLFFKDKTYSYFNIKYFSLNTLKEMLSYSWPMIPNSLSMWVMSVSDRLVLTFFMGLEANAVYAVANKIPSLFTVVQSTFTYAWQENASIAAKDKDVGIYYSKVFDVVFCMMAGVLTLLIAGTPILFALLIRGDYDKAYNQMPILFLGVFFSCITAFLGGIYIANKRTKSVGITTIIAAGINLIIDLIFVNMIGIYAASLSTLISYLFLTIYRLYDIQKFQKLYLHKRKIIVTILGLLLMCVLSFKRNIVFDIINIMFSIFFAIILNKKLIGAIFQNVRRRIIK